MGEPMPEDPARATLDEEHGFRIERVLRHALERGGAWSAPATLRAGLSLAVFPGGARLRPRLCMAVAHACGARASERIDGMAAAIELVHCASLVHDDLPCFDDAPLRRGRPSVQKAFGEATAVLVGDALIVLAFQTLARSGAPSDALVLAEGLGPSRGIIAGQAWEQEPATHLDEYHRAKTASLFEAAATMGALAAGADPAPWAAFGEAVGRAYQAADDVADASGEMAKLGKPVGVDAGRGRPSVVRAHGLQCARLLSHTLLDEACAKVPAARDATQLRAWIRRVTDRLGEP